MDGKEKMERRRHFMYQTSSPWRQFISSVPLEVPNMAANSHNAKHKVISKSFRRLLNISERQALLTLSVKGKSFRRLLNGCVSQPKNVCNACDYGFFEILYTF